MDIDEESPTLPERKCRQHASAIYEGFDTDSGNIDDTDSDFEADPCDDEDETFSEQSYRKSLKKNKKKSKQQNKPQTDRPLTGLYIPKKKHRRNNSDSDSDDVNFIIRDSTPISSIAFSREKRIKNSPSYNEDLQTQDESTEDTSAVPELVDQDPIEKLIGLKDSVEPQVFMVRLARSSNAEAQWMDRNEIESRPGGTTHLSSWDTQVSEYGLTRHRSIPFLLVPDAPLPENDESSDLEMDHIVGYDRINQLYLVKWKDQGYDDATWESTVTDERALQKFARRETYREARPVKPSCDFKEYGTGENCIPLPHYKNDNELRSYQIKALNWLLFAYKAHKNTILADEMGLGKTVMCIALLNEIVTKYGIPGPFLVVAPLGTLPNWEREIENWTDINCVMFHGSRSERSVIKKYEIFYDHPHEKVTKCQILLTNVETVNKELELIQSIRWHFVIIDEAHRLKNMHSKIYRYMYSLTMDHILLMTGTPIQNNIDEIFALLHFIEPSKFPSLSEFKAKHHNIESAEDVQSLKDALAPYMLRRKKKDVETSISAKEETIVEVELTRIQKFYYRLLIDRKKDELTKKYQKISELQNLAMQLRKVCNHPFLLPEVEREIEKNGEDPLHAMIESSGKLVFVDKLLAKLAPTGEKILIFSQMVRVLDILEDFLNYRHYKFERLDGQVQGQFRQQSIDRFNDKNSDVFIFLLCTKAGGVGLNLTAASTVIIYDSDWNPQNDVQAQARCHRIGQTRDVKVYRLITRGTYESEMFERASMKLGLDQAILDAKTENLNNMNVKQIEQLIKKGAYYILNEDETETDKFITEDIDEILEHRTKTLSQQTVDTDSTFSKASFVVDKDGDQLDINDEHFWERVLPNESRKHYSSFTEREDIVGNRARRTRSMNFTDDNDDDFEDEYGSTWSLSKLDKLFNQMVEVGFGRWEKIEKRVRSNISKDQIIDGCFVLLSILVREMAYPDDLLHLLFEGGTINLTPRQRRISSLPAFNNSKLLTKISKNAEQYAKKLMQLKAIEIWVENGRKSIRFDPHNAPKNWAPENDIKLLESIYEHGLGDWGLILNDHNIWGQNTPIKQVSAYSRRFQVLTELLIDGKAYEILSTPSNELKNIDAQTLRQLVLVITEVGHIPERISEIMSNVDRCVALVPLIITCARIVAALDPRSTQSIIRPSIQHYCSHTDNLAPIMSYQTAKRLCSYVNYLQRLRDQLELDPITQEKLSKCAAFSEDEQREPKWWKHEVHDLLLFNHLNEYGFYDISSLVLENKNFSEHLSEEEKTYIQSISDRKRKHGFLRQAKGQLAFLFQEEQLIAWIDEIILLLGGYKTPNYIDIPEKYRSGLTLPALYGSESIESIGTGQLYLMDNVLYKVGFRARVIHKNIGYRCSVLNSTLFEIWKSDRAKWTGDNPYDAWVQVDNQFDANPFVEFGLDCPIVQYEYLRHVDEDLPSGYVSPRVNFYQTESAVNKKKKTPKAISHQSPKKAKKKRSKKKDYDDESDSESEDDLQYDE